LEGWFLDTSITKIFRDNLAEWTAWAFFGKKLTTLSAEEIEENNEIIQFIEIQAKWEFPVGKNHELPSLRLNLDPIFVVQRPLITYVVVNLMNFVAHLTVKYILHFNELTNYSTIVQKIYYRKAKTTNSARNSPNTKKGLPIVFVHGIGIGFAQYMSMLFAFTYDVDVFLVEWPFVAMQMQTKCPTAERSVQAIISALDHYQHEKATFIAHSLGTVLIPWMLNDPQGAMKVASTVILDPVIFLLCEPKVVSMFVYKSPAHSLDLLMHFFLSRYVLAKNRNTFVILSILL
jgi:hypothetical protein